MEEKEFKVGDKVELHNRWGTPNIGKIIKITEKRKDITVDFGTYTAIFDSRGWEKGHDVYHKTYISKLTPEREREILDDRLITFCKKEVERVDITAEQARKILTIIKLGEKTT